MAATPPPGYTPPPADLPQRGDRATFSNRVDTWVTWFSTVILTQLAAIVANAYANAVDAAASAASAMGYRDTALTYRDAAQAARDAAQGYRDQAQTARDVAQGHAAAAAASAAAAANSAASVTATSATPLAVGSGSRTFTTQAGKQFATGQQLAANSVSAPANRMFFTVDSYSGTTLIGTVNIAEGAGTYSDWVIAPAGARGPTGTLSGGQLSGSLDELKGAAPAASATPNIWSAGGNYVPITATAAITGFPNAPQAGAKRTLKAEADFTLTNGANLIVHGGTLAIRTGDEVDVVADTISTFRATVRRNNGTPTVPTVFRNAIVLTGSQVWVAPADATYHATLVGSCGSGGVAVSELVAGASAAAASGGSAGGISQKTFTATAGDSFTLSLGAPGAGVTTGAVGTSTAVQGNDAADSTLTGPGVALTARGGKKGAAAFASTGNATASGATGGTASGGDTNTTGGGSGTATANAIANAAAAATGGGASPYRTVGYSSGTATQASSSGVSAASGGAGVGGASGNATATSTSTAYSGGGGSAGASPNSTAPSGAAGAGVAAAFSGQLVSAPLNLRGAGTPGNTTTASADGAGSGATAASTGNSALMGGTGGAVSIVSASGLTLKSGDCTLGGASGGTAIGSSVGNAGVTATSGTGGAAFTIIEWS